MKISSIFKIAVLSFGLVAVAPSCSEDTPLPWEWEGEEKEDPTPTPTPGDSTQTPEDTIPSVDPEPVPQGKPAFAYTNEDGTTRKPVFMWVDFSGNFDRFANSEENIKEDLEKAYNAGVTDIVVQVRPSTGDCLFKTSVGDPLTEIDAWTSGGYKWVKRTATFDYLQAFIDAGHALGLRINASIDTFTGGYLCPYGLEPGGMLFRDSSKKDWGEVLNTANGLVNTMDILDGSYDNGDWGAKFLNPANDEVVEYLLSLLADLAAYDIDGIVLDRCRYGDYNLQADFSDFSRAKFEDFIGEKIANWPSDVMEPGTTNYPDNPTKWYKKWIAFRAKMIHDFMEAAQQRIASVNPNCRFGAYVGAWYSSYYTSGVNWASPNYKASSDYSWTDWVSADWDKYGYADHTDFMLIGAYAGASSIYGDTEYTCEGFAMLGKEKFCGEIPFAAGPDVGNSTGWTEGGQGQALMNSIDACVRHADGYFLFDMCHVRSYNYWDYLKNGIYQYITKK